MPEEKSRRSSSTRSTPLSGRTSCQTHMDSVTHAAWMSHLDTRMFARIRSVAAVTDSSSGNGSTLASASSTKKG